MKRRDIAIIGYYETKFERRSGRSIYDVAGEAAAGAVDLPEGARLLGTLLGVAVQDVRIGMPVRVSYERLTDENALAQFVAAPAGEAPP